MENKKIVESFFTLFSNGKIDDAFSLVSDDVQWWVPGTFPFSGTRTKGQYLNVVSNIRNGFPKGFKLIVKSMIAEGRVVAAEVESHGQHINGKEYKNLYHFLIKLNTDGKFIEVKEYMDTLHLYMLLKTDS